MAINVGDVMRHCRNYFSPAVLPASQFIIENGRLAVFLPDGTWIAVCGSAYNDGVYQITNELTLKDETFEGAVYILHPPKGFLDLCNEIIAYDAKTPVSGMQSESFGGYSYNRATENGAVATWQKAFANRLNPFMRMFTEVVL